MPEPTGNPSNRLKPYIISKRFRRGPSLLHNLAIAPGVQGPDGLQEVGPTGSAQTEEEANHLGARHARVHQEHQDLSVLLAGQEQLSDRVGKGQTGTCITFNTRKNSRPFISRNSSSSNICCR